MNTIIYKNGVRFVEKVFKHETDFEEIVTINSKTLFGQNSIYVDAKKKISNKALGGVIPDGFLFDLSDIENPEFYIVEVELSKHDFFGHIFPQTTKYFAFFKNADSKSKLIEKLYNIFENDDALRNELKARIGKKEIFKFIKDTVENSENILMIIDDDKDEFPEIISTYTDTWGKMVKVALLKEYYSLIDKNDTIFTLTPDFENIEDEDIVLKDKDFEPFTTYTEVYHIEDLPSNIKNLYKELKQTLLNNIPDLVFNPQRYYISLRKKRNFAFLKFRRKKIAVVAMMEENKIRERIKNYNVAKLAESVQKFYNGSCARIDLTDDKHLDEVLKLLIEIQK
jgi:predicted transport protein